MKAKFSPLQLLDFKLLESHFEFIIPKEEKLDLKELFQSYAVEIDFRLRENEETKEIQLFTIIEVNEDDENSLPGYKIMVEGGGTFRIQDPESLEENLKNNLTQFSTLNMMINNLRNIIYQITNLGPMGGYLLPPIDITQLLRDKVGRFS
ncbi:preprotein translocase subunit SecB [Belliella kenyensis]|uniref:Preprotein translocase subunit SecB n=1 Tax=Belliella kenyensis TaxID=1472724 RepID=A0ABV8EJP1_9BACT|nr:preprotein translocase subunit SecB [Belliella kenyensis]MCH7400340.1 preprotein translocase subunit SecB [Belliella kenyensis]MDN3604642.1 preprotein translocase subunit SecB [Belliella kenyensis]